MSTPPTTAASAMPEAIARQAEAKAFALEEHAVEAAIALLALADGFVPPGLGVDTPDPQLHACRSW